MAAKKKAAPKKSAPKKKPVKKAAAPKAPAKKPAAKKKKSAAKKLATRHPDAAVAKSFSAGGVQFACYIERVKPNQHRATKKPKAFCYEQK